MKDEQHNHAQAIEMSRQSHESACRQAAEKVKLLVERKDQQTAQLREQLAMVQKRILSLTQALRA
jgi:hypothetical protein